MFIISNDKYMLYFDGWKPRIVRTWKSGVETCLLKGPPERQVEELKARLRYVGVKNQVTELPKPKRKRKKRSS